MATPEVNFHSSSFSDLSEERFICCAGGYCKRSNKQKHFTMKSQYPDVICEGVLEKKIDQRRRFSLGPTWKRKYCVLNSEAFLIFGKKTRPAKPSRTIPLCHFKGVKRLSEDNVNKIFHFVISTEQGEDLMFRCRHDKGWAAQVQIQMIHYKVRKN